MLSQVFGIFCIHCIQYSKRPCWLDCCQHLCLHLQICVCMGLCNEPCVCLSSSNQQYWPMNLWRTWRHQTIIDVLDPTYSCQRWVKLLFPANGTIHLVRHHIMCSQFQWTMVDIIIRQFWRPCTQYPQQHWHHGRNNRQICLRSANHQPRYQQPQL